MKKIFILILLLSMSSMACYMSKPTQQATITPPAGASGPTAITSAPIKYIPSPTGTQEPACIVTAEKLNVRKEPESDVIARLYLGDLVTVLEDAPRGAWIRIQAGSVSGWIHKDYCKGK